MVFRDLTPVLLKAANQAPSITLTGPRQSGKTTLCRAVFPEHPYVTLEAPAERAFAREDPKAFLAQYPDGAIIDEVQYSPDLLSYLQIAIDADPQPGRWILTGSQNLSLLETVSQSLAGRTAVHNLLPLTSAEISLFPQPPASLDEHLFAGGYPRIYDQELDPGAWLGSYVRTYLERDVRMVTNIGDLAAFQQFVGLCAGRTAQVINYSSLAADCSISQPTAKAWLSVLEASFIVFRLPAFHRHPRKRLVKMPKLYFHDTGLVCWLLGIRQLEQLRAHPLRGAIFETWVISEALKHRTSQGESGGLYFYRDHNGAEIDLVIDEPAGFKLVEAKSSTTPMANLMAGLKRARKHFKELERPTDAAVVYGGADFQQRSDCRLIPWRMVRTASLAQANPVVSVSVGSRPAADAEVLVLFPNKTWKRAITDSWGMASFELHATHLPMTVFVALDGFEAYLERDWIPAERALRVELKPLPGGGAAIFPSGRGEVPGLAGGLNPILDPLDRTYLYAANIAINDGRQQPVPFDCGEALRLTDADGNDRTVRIIAIAGRAALVEYLPYRK